MFIKHSHAPSTIGGTGIGRGTNSIYGLNQFNNLLIELTSTHLNAKVRVK